MDNPDDLQRERKQALERRWHYYQGKMPQPLKVRRTGVDDNLLIPLTRLTVDKGASFLFGQDVEIQVTDEGGERQQDQLDECWRRNKRGLFLLKLGTNGGIFGHAFARLLEPAQDDPFPRLVNVDPMTVDVVTNPQDLDDVWSFTITPPPQIINGEKVRRRTLITTPSGQAGYQVNVHAWMIVEQQFASTPTPSNPDAGNWLDIESSEWPYDFAPMLHCQNLPKPNEFWGESDLPDDILHLIDHGINRIASNTNKIIRVHASPKVYTSGMGKQNLDLSADAVTHLPSETARMEALKTESNLEGSMVWFQELMKLYAMLTRVPQVAMGDPDQLGADSGVAIKIRYQPLVEKTEAKRRTYGDLLVECDRRLLAMMGLGETTVTTQVWPEIVPSDDLAERQVAVLDDSLGVASKETIATKFGYSWEEEQERIQEEAKTAMENAAQLAPEMQPVNGQPVTPTNGRVPPPMPLQAPAPDEARTGKSR